VDKQPEFHLAPGRYIPLGGVEIILRIVGPGLSGYKGRQATCNETQADYDRAFGRIVAGHT
jgi:hypothetical protein